MEWSYGVSRSLSRRVWPLVHAIVCIGGAGGNRAEDREVLILAHDCATISSAVVLEDATTVLLAAPAKSFKLAVGLDGIALLSPQRWNASARGQKHARGYPAMPDAPS